MKFSLDLPLARSGVGALRWDFDFDLEVSLYESVQTSEGEIVRTLDEEIVRVLREDAV